MIFQIDPEQVQKLDSKDLVLLMKRLLLAECRATGVPVRGANVPLQITVADGGEDGRVEWSGGLVQTAYLPSRFTIFQSKAQALTESSVRKEVLKEIKGKGNKVTKKLSDAIKDVINNRGAYIIFCNAPMVGKKRDKLTTAIRNAITDGGSDPDALAAIEIYDANAIADWANSHPPVALWLAAQRLGRPLFGFQTHEAWGAAPEIANVPWQTNDTPRYVLKRPPPSATSIGNAPTAWTSAETIQEIREHLAQDGAVVRLAGPSGYGKSRFAYEALSDKSNSLADQVDASAVLYVDGSLSAEPAVNLSLEMAQTKSPAIMIVDECSDDLHFKLAQNVQRAGSKLRLLTIDTETKITVGEKLLHIQVEKSDNNLIQSIAKGVTPTLGDRDTSFIASLAEGFPRMAVLAAQQGGDGRQSIESIEQVLDRVVWGQRLKSAEAQRVLEIASLLDWFGVEGRVKDQVDWVAKEIGNMAGDAFAEHLKSFIPRGVVVQRGDFIQIAPIPLASRLGARRLSVMSADQLIQLYGSAPSNIQSSILKRMKWLDTSPTAAEFASRLLKEDALGNLAVLNTDFGSQCLNQLLHVNPDAAAATIDRVFGSLPLDQLEAIRDARRHLVWSLESLVFRESNFDRAATLLRRLAAVETEKYSNNATGRFKELYHLHLSGTEAPPAIRLLVLDDGLKSLDVRERRVCVEALGSMLETHHFTRFGGSEQIGSQEPSNDWQPKTYGDIWNFYRSAISRLLDIAKGDDDLAEVARGHLCNSIRGLLNALPFEDVKAMIEAVAKNKDARIRALHGISSWLYFDRPQDQSELGDKIRALYEETLPKEPLDLVQLYTHGWQSDLHDPDTRYSSDTSDFEYATRHARLLAKQIASDPQLSREAVERFACSTAHTLAPFAEELVQHVADPEKLFALAIQAAERSSIHPNRGLFGGLVAGADKKNHSLAQRLVGEALKSEKLKSQAISFIHASKVTTDEISLVVNLLKSGDLRPAEAEFLSYGQGLSNLSDGEMMPLLSELETHGSAGNWTILGIMEMVLHGGKTPSSDQLKLLRRVISRPVLTQSIRNNMDGHHLVQMVAKILAAKSPAKKFVRELTKNILSICRKGASDVFHHLDDPARQVLSTLSRHASDIVWEEIAKKLDSKDRLVRYYMETLMSPSFTDDYLGRGIAIDHLTSLYMEWVRGNPDLRALRAVAWLTIAVKGDDNIYRWHPELEAYIDEFADQPGVLGALSSRLFPSSGSGSRALHLESVLPMLESWRTHGNAALRAYASTTRDRLRQQIAIERKRDEEDAIRFG